jgi:hypothetical protein
VVFESVRLILLLITIFYYFVAFVELLGTVYASFLFMDIILLFMLTCGNLLVKSPLGGDLKNPLYGDASENPMMGMFDPFFAGTLTPLER